MLKNNVECSNIGFTVWGGGHAIKKNVITLLFTFFFLLKFCAPRNFAPGATAPVAPPTLRLWTPVFWKLTQASMDEISWQVSTSYFYLRSRQPKTDVLIIIKL